MENGQEKPVRKFDRPWRMSTVSAVQNEQGEWINPETGKPACGASCRDGRKCPSLPLKGRTRCKMHGGTSLRGPASPAFKEGGYAVDLPTHLAEMYQELADDPDWLSSKREIHLLGTRLRELNKRLTTGDGGSIFSKLAEIAGDYRAAKEAEDMEAAFAAAERMADAAEEGSEYEATWKEIQSAVDGISRVRDREVKRLVAQEQILTADQSGVLVAALVAAVRAEVKDKETLGRLGLRLQSILTAGKHTMINVESRPSISQEPV
jgi:hypothetical protein